MRILFLTGSRGEWGYIRPILFLCKERRIDYRICATNMHLLTSFGMSIEEIQKDGFEVSDQLYMALDGYNHYTMAKSMGILQSSFVDVLVRLKPDWIVLAGDRAETLVGAVSGAYTYTPVAHIQAGELSGNIDGQARHAIGKFAHLHFAANEDAAGRLLRLGEEKFRIHNVGTPQLDELVQGKFDTLEELKDYFNFAVDQPYLMVVQHPVTEDYDCLEHQINCTIKVINRFDVNKVWILPNNDAGSDLVRNGILQGRMSNIFLHQNIPRAKFLGLLKHTACIVGNSSTGLLEAPTFCVPAVNVGRRQHKRLKGKNVIDIGEFNEKDMATAIRKAISPDFRKKIKGCENPYGDGYSSVRILDILQSTPINDKLLVKRLTY